MQSLFTFCMDAGETGRGLAEIAEKLKNGMRAHRMAKEIGKEHNARSLVGTLWRK